MPPDVARATASAAELTRRAAGQTAEAVQSLLEDPRLRERLPGRSLALLGAGLVALALVLSWLPSFQGIGWGWSLVMLVGSALTGARELHAAGRHLPEPALRAARLAEHPLFLPAFTVLTFVHAFLTLSLGLVPGLWLLAAVVLGYDQRRALAAFVEKDGAASPAELRLGRWVLAGVLVCTLALFFSWEYRGGGFFLGGYQPYQVRDTEMDGFTRQSTTRTEWRYNMMMNWMPAYGASGRARPFASGALLALGGLGVLSRSRGLRATLPRLTLPMLAGAVTLWGLTGLSWSFTYLGPWIFLLGVVLVDVAVARELMHQPRESGGMP